MKTILLIAILMFSAGAAEPKPVEIQKAFKVVTRNARTTWFATAFFVSKNRLLTAAHTFEKSRDPYIQKDGREIRCRIVKIDFGKDIAVLECEEENADHYRLVSKVKVVGAAGGGDVVEHDGRIDLKYIHAKVYFVKGMSGGPLINEYGDVEGMGVKGDMVGDNNCRAIPASALASFLALADK